MDSYRIEETPNGWALFKRGSVRPLMESENKEEILERVEAYFAGRTVAVRVVMANGRFIERRY